jgi:hypothetical protein
MLRDLDFADAIPSPEPTPAKANRPASRFRLPTDFSEIRLFSLLIWKFHRPNGILTLVGRPGGDPDGPFKWDFVFSPDGTLRLWIIRGGSGIEVVAWGSACDLPDLLEYLNRNIELHANEINRATDTLESYTLLMNPFVRHRAMANLAHEELAKAHPSRPTTLPLSPQKVDVERYSRQWKAFMEAVEKQASLNMLLVMEAAFSVESLINLIIALLVRPEIRNSRAALDETLRRKWKQKIERLHIDCRYVAAPEMGNPNFRDAKEMFDLRNRIAHSFPDKVKMKLGHMWFQDKIPILETAEDYSQHALILHNQLPSVDEAKACWDASNRLIQYLQCLVSPELREQFIFFTESNPIGYNETKEMYGVPFGKTIFIFSGPVQPA